MSAKTEVKGNKSEAGDDVLRVSKETETAAIADEAATSTEVRNIVEALIFASDEPMSARFIKSIVDEANKDLQPHEQITVNAEIIRKVVSDLNKGYAKSGSAFRIIEVAGGFVHATQEQFAVWVGKLAKEKARRRLSPTAIETLAIIAYKQPITKAEVEFIRGVNADYIINALLEKDLITITGRQNSPGRPLLYGTTQKFLEHFGLNELSDLPKPREIAELINETEAEVDRRLLAEQQELEFKEDLEQKLEGHEGGAKKKERTPKQPKIVSQAVKSEDNGESGKGRMGEKETGTVDGSNTKVGVESRESLDASRSELESNSGSSENVRSQKLEGGDERLDVGNGEVDEKFETGDKVETKSGKGSNVSEIGEQKIEEQIERAIEAEKQVEETVETNAEPAVPFYQEKNIQEGVEVSAQHADIEEANLEIHSTNTRTEQGSRESGWSKWKTKVKTFFKKLFG